jgi:hypothetical protein
MNFKTLQAGKVLILHAVVLDPEMDKQFLPNFLLKVDARRKTNPNLS